MAKLEISCEVLKQLYCKDQLSAPMIAAQYNCSYECIYSHLRECKIAIRTRGHNKAVPISQRELENLYLVKLWAFRDLAEFFHTSEDTISRKLKLYSIPKRHYHTCQICKERFPVISQSQEWKFICPDCEAIKVLCPCGCGQLMPKFRCSGELRLCANRDNCKTPNKLANLQKQHDKTWETRICKNCKNEFEIPRYLANIFCTRKCRDEYNHGPNHGSWKGGTSNESYPFEFDEDLKQQVRRRDNFTCQLCGISQDEYAKQHNDRLSCHHINYLKNDLRKENLISLCRKCHSKTHTNREYWQPLFEAKIAQIYSGAET